MERTKKEKPLLKTLNRSLSYLILLFSVFAVCFTIDSAIKYVSLRKENINLEEKLSDLKEENDRLGILNSKLKDKDYFSVYVKDKYQYSSNSNSVIEID